MLEGARLQLVIECEFGRVHEAPKDIAPGLTSIAGTRLADDF